MAPAFRLSYIPARPASSFKTAFVHMSRYEALADALVRTLPSMHHVSPVQGKAGRSIHLLFAFSRYYQSIILTPHFLQNKNKSVSFA